MRPPSSLSGSICHLPPTPGGAGLQSRRLSWNQLLPDSTSTMLPAAWIVKILEVPFGYRRRPKNTRHATQFLRQENAAADRRARRAPPQVVFGAKRLRLPVFLRRPAALRQRWRERD